MNSDELTKAKDEVYRLIGRNMLLFQQIEQMLKALLNNARFVGTASDIKKLQEQGAEPDKRMLGKLIKPLVENHLTSGNVPPPPVPTGKEIGFSFNITFEHSPEERASFQKQPPFLPGWSSPKTTQIRNSGMFITASDRLR